MLFQNEGLPLYIQLRSIWVKARSKHAYMYAYLYKCIQNPFCLCVCFVIYLCQNFFGLSHSYSLAEEEGTLAQGKDPICVGNVLGAFPTHSLIILQVSYN